MRNTAYYVLAQTGRTPLAIGAPGTGKSQSNYGFARKMCRQCYTMIGSLRDPADVGGYPYPGEINTVANGDGHKVYMRLIPPEWVANCRNGQKWVVFMDELTTCPPAVQSAMLRVIAEKVVGDTPLPESTWIIAACNPPEQAANGVDIEPPLANRMGHYAWDRDDELILRGFSSGLQFDEPSFPLVPEDWRKHIYGIGGMATAFHTRCPGRLHQFPKERSLQCGPWPSPRTWQYAIEGLAACKAADADRATEFVLLAGLIGNPVAEEFFKWMEALDLPDPEALIKKAMAANKSKKRFEMDYPRRPDQVMAMLSSITTAIIANNNADRWEAGMAIVEVVTREQMDVAIPAARALVRACKASCGGKFSENIVNNLFPRIMRVFQDI